MILFLLLLILNIGINIWGVYTLYTHFQGGLLLFIVALIAISFKLKVND